MHDNHPVEPPGRPENGYHLADDMADKAVEFIRDAKVIDPDKPFFMYLTPRAGHAPHLVPLEWADRYKGVFDEGYEAVRAGILEPQVELGLLPEGTELSDINPYGEPERTGPDGQPWPLLDTVRAWDSLNPDEQRLFTRNQAGRAVVSSPLIDNGRVIFGTTAGSVVALSVSTGSVEWITHSPSAIDAAAAAVGSLLIVGSANGTVSASNAATGHMMCQDTLSGPVMGSPAVDGTTKEVVVGAGNTMTALSTSTGAVLWTATTGGPVTADPSIAGNAAYVGSGDATSIGSTRSPEPGGGSSTPALP